MTPAEAASSPARAALAVAAAAFCVGYATFALNVVPSMQVDVGRDLGLGPADEARALAGVFVAAALGGLVLGRIADFGRRRAVLAASVLVPAAGLALAAWAPDGDVLAVARWISGFGIGGAWGVAHAALAELLPRGRRGFASGVVQAAVPLAVVAAALAAYLAATRFGWRGTLRACAAPGLLAPLLPAALAALPDRAGGSGGDAAKAAFRSPGVLRAASVLLVMLAAQLGAFWFTYAKFPGWLRGDLGLSPEFVLKTQVAIGAGFVAGDLAFGAWIARLGPRRAYVCGSALFAAGLAAIAVWLPSLHGRPVAAAALLAATGFGAGLWSAFGPLYALHVPRSVRASTAATSYQLARAAQGLLLPWGDAVRASRGYPGLFLVAAVFAALGGLAVFLLPARGAGDDPS
ncbi:MAG TPA: MFS transporter [Planctomycetota bacterium]|nr:MFS transporter [Planctomycetota bacterium]